MSWRPLGRVLRSAGEVVFSLGLVAFISDAEGVYQDVERCVRAIQSRDARFDGWFFTGVVTTGVYCRPSCPVVPPKVENMRFYPSAAAAQLAGFRACKRCRPDVSPGSPQWNDRADLVARAMRLIEDGVVDRDGVIGLAARLGYSIRQIQRQLLAALGAGPLALARAQRAQTARLLIETTTMPMGEAAYAAGFASVRAFNDTVREIFGLTPSQLRARVTRRQSTTVPGSLLLRLPFRRPLCPDNLFGYLAATAVPGVEEWRDGAYRRTLRLPHGHGIAALRPLPEHIDCRLTLTDLRDLSAAINRCRWLLDLDADPVAIDDVLRTDPLLAPIVNKNPGRRVPRTVDGAEFALRAVLAQQVSTTVARTHAGRLVAACGSPVADPAGGLTHLFPDTASLMSCEPATLALPQGRRTTVITLIAALASGDIDIGVGSEWNQVRTQLTGLPGIGSRTIETIAMRALGDPDAFIPSSPGIRRAARILGLPSTSTGLNEHATAWRPWRAYAAQHLWATTNHPSTDFAHAD